MTAQEFLDWMDRVDARFGADIVRLLGLGRNDAQRMVSAAREGRDLDLKLSVRLAMSAVANDLAPWSEEKGEDA